MALAACGREGAGGDAKKPDGAEGARGGAREVVVYCSADAPVAQPVFDAFEKKTGIKVKAVFDTEATKTTGLVNRLIAEHEQKKTGPEACDVWWSSEPFGTIRLSRAGALEKYESTAALASWKGTDGMVTDGSWPGARAKDQTWYGFARRVRVIVYNTKFVTKEELGGIHSWTGLSRPQWKGRIGMARPQFGTTRGHMAMMHATDDGRSLRKWLEGSVANDLRLYEGNASVAKAVASGELYLGLTDSDDAINGIRQGWPLGISLDVEPRAFPIGAAGYVVSTHTLSGMVIPNTVAVVAGGSHPAEARELVDFLLSKEAGEVLSKGEACALMFGDTWMPELRGLTRQESSSSGIASGLIDARDDHMDYERIADHVEPAMKVCEEVLKGR